MSDVSARPLPIVTDLGGWLWSRGHVGVFELAAEEETARNGCALAGLVSTVRHRAGLDKLSVLLRPARLERRRLCDSLSDQPERPRRLRVSRQSWRRSSRDVREPAPTCRHKRYKELFGGLEFGAGR
jgi:hypothetical protein